LNGYYIDNLLTTAKTKNIPSVYYSCWFSCPDIRSKTERTRMQPLSLVSARQNVRNVLSFTILTAAERGSYVCVAVLACSSCTTGGRTEDWDWDYRVTYDFQRSTKADTI
jgi:hypothetical protein